MERGYVLQAVDFLRAEDPDTSRPLIVQKFTIPAVKFITVGHTAGGGVIGMNYAVPRIEPLEPTMVVKAIDREIFLGMGAVDRWTFAAAYRETRAGAKAVPVRGVIEGALTEWESDETDPEGMQTSALRWAEVGHFEFTFNGEELLYIDEGERVLRRKGIDLYADTRAALGG